MGEIRVVPTCASAWIATRFAWTQRWETLSLQSLHHYYAPPPPTRFGPHNILCSNRCLCNIIIQRQDCTRERIRSLRPTECYTTAIILLWLLLFLRLTRLRYVRGCSVEVQHITYITAHIVSRFHRRIDWPRDSGLTLIHLLVEAATAAAVVVVVCLCVRVCVPFKVFLLISDGNACGAARSDNLSSACTRTRTVRHIYALAPAHTSTR